MFNLYESLLVYIYPILKSLSKFKVIIDFHYKYYIDTIYIFILDLSIQIFENIFKNLKDLIIFS